MRATLDMFKLESDTRPFAAGRVIFTRGESGDTMYVVLEGEVELRINDHVLEVVGPAEPFGEMALIDGSERAATAIARTDCKVVAIPEKRFLFLVQQTPHFALQLMRVIVSRLRRMDERVAVD